MKLLKLLHITFLALAVVNTACAQTNAPPPTPAKPKIGIMKFEVGEDMKPSLGTFLYESFSGEMLASGIFTVVDSEQMEKVQKVVAQAQPNVSPEEARRMALHQLGIEKLYLGTLTKVGSKFYLTVKLLNLDLKVERSERLPAASEDDLEPTVVKLAKLLAASPEQAKEIKAQLDRQKAETDRWVEVEKNRTEDSLAAFLKEFPDGAMAAKAKKTVEELHNQRAADEEARKAKELQEGIKRQEAGRLKLSIAGRWKLETTAGTVTGGQNHGMVFNPIPGGVICDMQQKGAAVSFKAPYRNLYGGGQCVYKGTYESGSFHAEGKNVIVTGNISEDGRKIVGNWNWGGMSGTAVFTRVDAEAKP